MCGIVGYVGGAEAAPLLAEGLRRLEYRGYDSAGVAVIRGGAMTLRRRVGRLAALEESLRHDPPAGTCGIGHTRWATHGPPTEANAHPHLDCGGRLAVVHNGIIENYLELRRALEAGGHVFRSDTDTEVLPHLVEEELRLGDGLVEALRRALARATGSYAIAVLDRDEPGTIYAARRGSPLIVGRGGGEMFLASDANAWLGRADGIAWLDDGDLAVITRDAVRRLRPDGGEAPPDWQPAPHAPEAAERAGFETHMLKEIHEQPRILRGLLARHLTPDGTPALQGLTLPPDYFRKLSRVMIVSCGTAYHAGLYGKLLLEHLTGLAVETDLASEFRYRDPKIDPGTLIVPVSQSGETADTLAAVRLARSWGCKILGICNVPGSTLTRECDAVFFTEAGPEIGVASTKAYTAQLMAFALLALHIAVIRRDLTRAQARAQAEGLRAVPDAVHYVLGRADDIRRVADKHHDGPSSLYLGRRFNVPTALEGALKNKEISYQHAEGYAAGEMKHGPIALISEYMPVVCICTRTDDEVHDKMLSNMKEVEARRGRIIAVASDGDPSVEAVAGDVLRVPAVADAFSPLVNVVALQLLAYYAAQARGTDIDRPRNLAKSVTVE